MVYGGPQALTRRGVAVRPWFGVYSQIFQKDESIRILKIPEVSARLAAAYAKKTRKTMVRDVNKLISMGLIERTKEGVCAKRDVILAFLPAKKFN